MYIVIPTAPGRFDVKEMPHSEVCMHMQVAGKYMGVQVLPTSYGNICAQLYEPDIWTPFSFPISGGEAGILKDGWGYYYSEYGSRVDPDLNPLSVIHKLRSLPIDTTRPTESQLYTTQHNIWQRGIAITLLTHLFKYINTCPVSQQVAATWALHDSVPFWYDELVTMTYLRLADPNNLALEDRSTRRLILGYVGATEDQKAIIDLWYK